MTSQYANRYNRYERPVKPSEKFSAQKWQAGKCRECTREPVQINQQHICKKCFMARGR